MTNLFKQNKIFLYPQDFNIKEYIYILNYTNELIKKYDQGIIGPILKNITILILKKEKNYFTNYITDILRTLEIFECKIFVENTFLYNDMELIHMKILVTTSTEYILEEENFISINPFTFSTILALSHILSYPYHNQNLPKKENNLGNIEKFLDNHIFETIIKEILEHKQNLGFLKDINPIETDIKIKSALLLKKEIILTISAIIITILRSNL